MVIGFSVFVLQDDDPTEDGSPAGDQASPVIEPSTESEAPPKTVLHVDARHETASDDNPGTRRLPLASIGAAVKRADNLRSAGDVTILIRPATYRETITITATERVGRLRLEGLGEGVVVSGSDVWTDWTRAGGDTFSHPWTFDWGESPLPDGWEQVSDMPGIVRRREMVFADGQRVPQVSDQSALASNEMGFYVAEDRNELILRLANGADQADSRIEVALRSSLLEVSNRDRITLDNMSFQHAASPVEGAAVSFREASNVTVTDSNFSDNNWRGLGLSRVEDVRIENSSADRNGVGGFSAYAANRVLFENTETSYNNWRGIHDSDPDERRGPTELSFVDWGSGQKFLRSRDLTFRNHRSIGNLTGGLWFDYDNARIVLDGVELMDNYTHGVFIEASQGPVEVRNSLICGNETGILVANSEGVSIAENEIGDNRLAQIFLGGTTAEPRVVEDRESGESISLHSGRWRIAGNRIVVGKGALAFASSETEANWAHLLTSFLSTRNQWGAPDDAPVFQVPSFRELAFVDWQRETGQDGDSVQDASLTACAGAES